MNCPQCQTANSAGSAFCGNCGARMAAAETAAPAGYPPPQGYNPSQGYQGYQAPQGNQGPRQWSLPPVNFDHTRLARADKIIAAGTFIAMISIWLPWFSISWGASTFESAGSASISGTTGHGWLWLEFFVALVLLAYLAARAAWDRLPFTMPVAHAPLLVVGTSLQLLLVLIAFLDIPYSNDGVGLDWGAFLGLLAALAAAGPVVTPAVRSYLDRRKAGRPTY